MIAIDLLFNLTLLVSLSIVSGYIETRWSRYNRMGVVLQGMLFGGAAVIGMLYPLTIKPGLIFDGRSIMVSLCALFFGPLAAAPAGIMAIICRIVLGGTGTVAGVLVILSSIAVGLLAYARIKPNDFPPSTLSLYFFGLAVHVVMLVLLFSLPGGAGLVVIRHIGLPVIVFYPLATILVGKILSDQVTARRVMEDLQTKKENLSITLQSIGDAVISTDMAGKIVFMNAMAEKLTGWSQEEACGRPQEEVFRIICEETGEKAEDPVARVLEKGLVIGLANHTLLIAKDGVKRSISDSAAPIRDSQGKISGVVLVFRDQEEQRSFQRLIGMRLAMHDYATTHDLDSFLTKALDDITTLVGSPIGFCHFVDTSQITITLQQWSSRTVREFCKTKSKGMEKRIDQAGIWADSIRLRKPMVYNDYASLPNKKDLPEGHPQIVRQLIIPVLRDDKIVAIFGVGNKAKDYTDNDVVTATYLSDITWDIVERKCAEQVLQESEMLFRHIFENHSAIKLLIDSDTGNIVDANLAAQKFYGWSKDQLLQMRIQDINAFSPDEVDKEMAKARNLHKVYFEFRHRLADGSLRDVQVFSSNINLKGKDLLHSIVHDITERKQTEKMLQDSEERYRKLIDNAPIGIFCTNSQGQVLSGNTVMANILGFATQEEAFEHYNDLKEKVYVEPGLWDVFLKKLQDKGFVKNFEVEVLAAGDRKIWLNMNARISSREDDGSFIIDGFATDITEHRRLEEQLRQAQKMESVGRLAGGVAHDYNNMLNVIVGYAELAMERVDSTTQLYDDLQEILKAANRSTEVTRQLLAFARKQTISPQVIDLNETVGGMLKMLRPLIGENINLAWRPAGNLQLIKIDPSQLDQVLANLCVNARDAISGVGNVVIETAMVTLDETYCRDHRGFIPGVFVQLAVSDDGCGMDKETQGKLFEPFFTTKGLGKGTGLGLATVYGIVKQNNGFINVYSEPGKGSIFRIYLPCHEGEAMPSTEEDLEKLSTCRGEKILVVEDETAILNLSRTILERLGYSVFTADTTVEAVELAKQHAGKIDLLITDVIMPEMNGRDLADHLHTFCPEMKNIFMSGYTADVIARHGVLDEGVSFIQKPFSRTELAGKVREALDV